MKNAVFIACCILGVVLAGCSKPREYLTRKPNAEEFSGDWRSSDVIPGSTGEIGIKIAPAKSCEVSALPIYDQDARGYKVFSGSGQWMINVAIPRKNGYLLVVMPNTTRLSAALEIMTLDGEMVLQYSPDPETPQRAIFRKIRK